MKQPPKRNFRNVPFLHWTLVPTLLLKLLRTLGLAKPFVRLYSRRNAQPAVKRRVFKNYRPTLTDVFATVYSKSGTNLLMQALLQVAWKGKADFDHVHDLVAWPEAPFPGIVPIDDPAVLQACPAGKRFIKTAMKADYVPFSPEANYFCILRDPKEVAVSSYHFLPTTLGFEGVFTVAEWVDLFLSPDFMIGCWAEHAASFWALRDQPNVHLFHFANVRDNPAPLVEHIAKILRVDLNAAEKAEVLHRISFAWMKANESQFAPPTLPAFGKTGKMLRSGKSGKSGELLTKEMQDRIDAYFSAKLERLGSDFPYAKLYKT